jgi:hypothetical protein
MDSWVLLHVIFAPVAWVHVLVAGVQVPADGLAADSELLGDRLRAP